MSIIGSFGICPKNNYRMLVELIKNNNLTEAEVLIKKIYHELKDSEEKLENPCSGEVFIALFDYFKTALGVDVRDNITTDMAEKWREITDDFDIIVLCNKEQLLSLEDIIDYNKISQYINDFFHLAFILTPVNILISGVPFLAITMDSSLRLPTVFVPI